jgi:hypothetical protein
MSAARGQAGCRKGASDYMPASPQQPARRGHRIRREAVP